MVSILEIAAGWKRKHKWWFRALAVFFAMPFILFFLYLYVAYLLPLPPVFEEGVFPSTKILDRNGKLLYEVIRPDLGNSTIVPLKALPDFLLNATLAAEDINFYNHPGVDVWAIGRAVFFNITEGRIVSGASTITQQLTRNILGKTESRGYTDKLIEAAYAIRLTNIYSKDEILELYLNRVYYGNMFYGAQAAALGYFGKNPGDLDLAESALLAGLPQSPSLYNPFDYFDLAKKRQKYVLDQMVKYGFITGKEADAAFAEPLKFRPAAHPIRAPHFVHHVLASLEHKYGEDAVNKGGLTVVTTLDIDMQTEAENIIERKIERLERNNVQNGALLAMDVRSGQILAWVGSADYFNAEIDGAVDMVTALRQPGSSIKPLTYLLAFEKGYTPATVIFDVPTQFATDSGPYSPKNYDLKFHGPVRVRTALASSLNIPAVKTLEYAGVEDFIAFLKKMGIDTLNMPASFYGLALTLGGGEVRMTDMAVAYNTIANHGMNFDYSTILEVTDGNGILLEEWESPRGRYVLGPRGREHTYLIIDILSDAAARLTGFGESTVLELPFPAAVKTGTTRNFKDNWTIGFTPNLLTAVWVGNADASPMENITGITGAAPVWSEFMRAAKGMSPISANDSDFQIPAGIVEKEICEISGKIPTEYCDKRVYELFARNEEPSEYDDYHKLFNYNVKTGMIIQDACVSRYNPLDIEQKVLIAYPAGLQKWAAQNDLALPPFEPCALSVVQPPGYTEDYPDGEYSYSADVSATDQNSPDEVKSLTPPLSSVSESLSPPDENREAPSIQSAGEHNEDTVLIESPAARDEFLLQSELPLVDQKIPFRISAPYNTVKVEWFVDGAAAGISNDRPFTMLWLPSPGTHRVKAAAALSSGEILETTETVFYIK